MTVRWALEGDVLVLTTGAHFRTEDLVSAVEEALRDPNFKPPVSLLWDNRHSAETAPQHEIKARAGMLGLLRRSFDPFCAVVVSDELHYGLARMGAAYAEMIGFNVRAFDDIEEAREWLATMKQHASR